MAKISIPTADLKNAFNSAISSAIGAERELAMNEKAEVASLVEAIYPLIVSETQSLITNPTVAQGYLAVLQGAVETEVARLGLQAISVQKQQLASAVQIGVQLLGILLKAAVPV